ncbi:hypothetical protein CASFOL_031318 [Castilleja foliolosa]|uniref:Glycosyltransferase n=1 Tax=Castilleja foliolosa TaxID=1961234 RepID=A0ABD3C4C8_9LAMI
MENESVQLVFIPWPVMGHVQIVEFAKLIIHRQSLLSPDAHGGSYADSLSSSSSTPGLNFFHLPSTDPTPEWSSRTRGYFIHNLVLSQKPNIAGFLRSCGPSLTAVVVDMLCTSMIDVAEECGTPAYVFFTSPASFLGAMLHCQTLQDEQNIDVPGLKNSDTDLEIPSFARPVPPNVMSLVLVDERQWLDRFLHYARDYRKAKGIIVNTCVELETHALTSFLQDPTIPPVYPVGPILNRGPSSEVLGWLHDQPPCSVVFVCFGSQGSLDEDQVRQLATGIERSGKRFLWALRRQAQSRVGFPIDYTSYDDVLPEGFLDRTSQTGRVVGWVSQLDALSHPAVGGFVSHCGWNSVLESVWCGVPIATWPLHAEQQMNAFQLVKELGLAVEITLSYCERSGDGEMVAAEVIERGIREVMESGSEVRERVREMREKSRASVREGGSSFASLNRFIDCLMSGVSE